MNVHSVKCKLLTFGVCITRTFTDVIKEIPKSGKMEPLKAGSFTPVVPVVQGGMGVGISLSGQSGNKDMFSPAKGSFCGFRRKRGYGGSRGNDSSGNSLLHRQFV